MTPERFIRQQIAENKVKRRDVLLRGLDCGFGFDELMSAITSLKHAGWLRIDSHRRLVRTRPEDKR